MENNRFELNKNLAQMLKGGVIMDVTTPEQAKIAEAAGACAVMALERIPADIRAAGGVSRMSDPKMIKGIQDAVEGYISYLKMGGSYDLYVVGFGKEKFVNNLKLAIPEKYRMKVHFLGQRNDIYKLMSSSLAIIVPSFFEAFGRVTAEAMLNSCLVIGRNTGGTKEQFDNGFDLCHKEIGLRFTTTKEIAYHLYDIENKGINFYQEMIKNADFTASHLYAVEKNANNIYSFYKNMKNV